MSCRTQREPELFHEMFEFITAKLAEEAEKTGKDWGCDDSFRFTREFSRNRGLNERAVIDSMVKREACCDWDVAMGLAVMICREKGESMAEIYSRYAAAAHAKNEMRSLFAVLPLRQSSLPRQGD